jgi:hypothetical protein
MFAKFATPIRYATNMVSPAFYKGLWNTAVTNTHKEIRAGSSKPIWQMLFLYVAVGYSMKYYVVGQYRMKHKKELMDKYVHIH